MNAVAMPGLAPQAGPRTECRAGGPEPLCPAETAQLIPFQSLLAGYAERAEEDEVQAAPDDAFAQEREDENPSPDEVVGTAAMAPAVPHWPPAPEPSGQAPRTLAADAPAAAAPLAGPWGGDRTAEGMAEPDVQGLRQAGPPAFPSDRQEAKTGQQELPPAAGQMEAAAPGPGLAEKIAQAMAAEGGGEDAPGQPSAGKKPPSVREEGHSLGSAGLPPPETAARPDAAADLKGAAVERALGRFLEDFRGAEAGGSELRLVLEPEELGVLTISVAQSEQGIVATIRSGDEEVCAAVRGQIRKLVASMESKGITVRDVDVLLDQGGRDQDLTGRQNSGGGQQSTLFYQPRAKRAERSGAARAPLWQPPAIGAGEETGGTVECRA
ncbi:MAG: hypothetical protein GX585_02865 [Clostridiales bacterium]|nr:hypothetical protein [Clostridiales bacterium]